MAKSKTPLYDWQDGKGKIHTIPKATHVQNVEAKGYGIDLNAPVSAPLDTRGAYGQAQQAADLEYGPQITQATNVQAALPTWYGDYLARVGAAQTAQQTYAQNVLAPVQAWASQAASSAPGLDSSSAAGQASAQAAKSGQGLAQLGYSTLAAIPTASNQYYGGLQATAARDQVSAQQMQSQKVGDLKQARGQAVVDNYGKIRANEQNAQIAYGTLNLNADKAAADTAIATGKDPVTGKDLPKEKEKPYTSGPFSGYTPTQVRTKSTKWKDAKKDEYAARAHSGTPTQAEKDAAAAVKAKAKKHDEAVKATGQLKVDVDNLIAKWRGLDKSTTDDTSKPILDPITKAPTGKYEQRPLTAADKKAILGAKYDAGMIHVALLVGKKPLDAAAIRYLKSKHIRIPREWLKGPTPSSGGSTAPPSGRPVGGTDNA